MGPNAVSTRRIQDGKEEIRYEDVLFCSGFGSHHQVFVASHGKHEHPANLQCYQWRKQCSKEGPYHQSVPLPLPQQVDQLHRMPVTQVENVCL